MSAATLPQIFARLGIHYAWAVVAVIFLTMLATAAVMGMAAVLVLPLKSEFGWDLGAISAALAVRFLVYGLVAPFTPAIVDRYGVRLVVAAALVLVFVSLALVSQMTALWQLWLLWGMMIGFSTGITASVLGAVIATRWFVRQRGFVNGLLGASSATGQILFLPITAWIADAAGWRFSLIPAVVLCLLCLVLVVLIVRDYPKDVGLPPYGGTAIVIPQTHQSASGALLTSLWTLREIASNRTFLVLAGTFFICGLSTAGLVQNHFIPLCTDFGVATIVASNILAMMGAFNFIGTIASGWLSDRYDNRYLLFWYYGLRGLSLVALPYTNFSIYGLSIFAIFYGLDWIATIPPTVRLANDEFGRERGPLAFGWIFFAHTLGSALAAYGAGASRDQLLTYLPAFIVAGIACLVAAIAILTIRERSNLARA